MQKKEKSKLGILICVVVLGIFFILSGVTAEAGFSTRTGMRDENGNILFQFRDRPRKVSSMGYRTIGITIHRTIMGTRDYSPKFEYVTIPFTSDVVTTHTTTEGEYIITSLIVSEDAFLERVAAHYPDWLAELQSGDLCYVIINAVMICVEYDLEGSRKEHGKLIDDGTRTGVIIGNTYWNRIDMKCRKCGGVMPPLMAGFCRDIGDGTPICFGHIEKENIKDIFDNLN